MQDQASDTTALEKVLVLNQMLTERLAEVIDVKDELELETAQLRQELATLRADGIAFLKRALASAGQLREQIADQEGLLRTFKEFDNLNIEQDLVDCIIDGQRMSIGEYWKSLGLEDPRQRWEGFEL